MDRCPGGPTVGAPRKRALRIAGDHDLVVRRIDCEQDRKVLDLLDVGVGGLGQRQYDQPYVGDISLPSRREQQNRRCQRACS